MNAADTGRIIIPGVPMEAEAMERVTDESKSGDQPWNKTGDELTEQIEREHAEQSNGRGDGETKAEVTIKI